MSFRSILSAVLPGGIVQRVVLGVAIAAAGVQTVRLSGAESDAAQARTETAQCVADGAKEKTRLWNEYVTGLAKAKLATDASSEAAVDDEAARLIALAKSAAANAKLKETHGATPLTPLQRAYLDRVRAGRVQPQAAR